MFLSRRPLNLPSTAKLVITKEKGSNDVKQMIATTNKEITLIKEFRRQESCKRIMTVTSGTVY